MYLLKILKIATKNADLRSYNPHPPEALTVLRSNQLQATTPTHPQPHAPRFEVQRLLGNFNHLTNVTSLHQVIQVCLSFSWQVSSVLFSCGNLIKVWRLQPRDSYWLLDVIVIPLWWNQWHRTAPCEPSNQRPPLGDVHPKLSALPGGWLDPWSLTDTTRENILSFVFWCLLMSFDPFAIFMSNTPGVKSPKYSAVKPR
jgi:hypothetical protein